MRKLLLLCGLITVSFGAVLTTRPSWNQIIGFMPAIAVGSFTETITNSAGTSVVMAYSFVAPSNPFGGTMRLQDITVFANSVSGSPALTAKLYSDSSGVPGTLIEAGTQSATVTASTWNTLSGFTVTSNLTEGTQYWIVVQCTAGTNVGVNVYRMNTNGPYPGISTASGSGKSWGNQAAFSTDNASTWGAAQSLDVFGFRIGLTDGTDTAYQGWPISANALANGATEKLYTNAGTAQEFGSQFTSPSGPTLNIRGIQMVARNVTATGNLRFRIYTGSSPSLAGTTNAIPLGNVSTGASGDVFTALFSSPVAIAPSTVVTVTAGNTAADSSTTYFDVQKYTIQNDANSKAIFPFGGIKSANFTGGAWTYVDTQIVPFGLILDPVTPFTASGGGQVGYAQ